MSSYTLTLCKQLQTVNADLVEACNHVDNVLAILDGMRKNEKKIFFFVAAIMLNKKKEEINFFRFINKQTYSSNVNSSEEYYKLNICLPIFDYIRTQICDKFQKYASL